MNTAWQEEEKLGRPANDIFPKRHITKILFQIQKEYDFDHISIANCNRKQKSNG